MSFNVVFRTALNTFVPVAFLDGLSPRHARQEYVFGDRPDKPRHYQVPGNVRHRTMVARCSTLQFGGNLSWYANRNCVFLCSHVIHDSTVERRSQERQWRKVVKFGLKPLKRLKPLYPTAKAGGLYGLGNVNAEYHTNFVHVVINS